MFSGSKGFWTWIQNLCFYMLRTTSCCLFALRVFSAVISSHLCRVSFIAPHCLSSPFFFFIVSHAIFTFLFY
ncbi:hypothetical protein BJ138DRAFT_1155784, partial [Hygrophoropsis aurantiaca]